MRELVFEGVGDRNFGEAVTDVPPPDGPPTAVVERGLGMGTPHFCSRRMALLWSLWSSLM